MRAAVAAGHPATTAAGIEILAAGGSAADAAVAASLASCVAETVMTGLLGGGHAIYFDAASGTARNLDCFVAVPGLGAEPRKTELLELQVPFGAELVHYAVGPASCGVPGLSAGLVALWEAHGTLPWERLVEPALRLAESGVEFPPAHAACLAMLAPVMTMNEGARIEVDGLSLWLAGVDSLWAEQASPEAAMRGRRLPAFHVATFGAALADDRHTVYGGAVAEALIELCRERGGLVTHADLAAYEARWSEPLELEYLELRLLTRGGLSGMAETVSRLPRLAELDEAARVLALVEVLESPSSGGGDTTTTPAPPPGGTSP